jgi:hypothetical protein
MVIFILLVSLFRLMLVKKQIDLFLGGGDPTLGSWRWNDTNGDTIMTRWVNLIKQEGIKQCRGVIADLSVWPEDTQTIPDGYSWGDIGFVSVNDFIYVVL